MKLQQLKYLVTVAECGSITEAARRLFVSQPSITASIRDLEREMGVTVFERVNSSVYSKRIVEGVGLTGAIRVSPMHCHTVEDIEEYLRITKELAEEFAK